MDKRLEVLSKIRVAEDALYELTAEDFKDVDRETAISILGKLDMMHDVLFHLMTKYEAILTSIGGKSSSER